MRLTRPKSAAVGAVAVLGLALTACGGGDEHASGHDATDAVPVAATGSLEHLASEAGCKPNMQTDADTIRQAICKNSDGKFVLATFATDRGQAEWLSGAKDYGGYYLVGRKWVAVGPEKTVAALQDSLGGALEEGSAHMNPGGSHNSSGHSS
ncbi:MULTISPECIES: hypothetical protein [Streptomyces]|uniref:Lipoprotein n=1 Tax=Streptomyces sp. NBC_00093 TaxID=2975649 RepID=A0AAU2AAX9_9ACTN|nr:hypothetical protein [Streptomyces sp. GQFP]UIX35187.1 hypothetical protein LUX31_37180 [Streptomyces sp. GQFP]